MSRLALGKEKENKNKKQKALLPSVCHLFLLL